MSTSGRTVLFGSKCLASPSVPAVTTSNPARSKCRASSALSSGSSSISNSVSDIFSHGRQAQRHMRATGHAVRDGEFSAQIVRKAFYDRKSEPRARIARSDESADASGKQRVVKARAVVQDFDAKSG